MINNQDYKIADKEISSLRLNHKEGEKIKDESIVEIFIQSKKIIKKYFNNKIFLTTNQIPRGGKEYLNCERAFDIFGKRIRWRRRGAEIAKQMETNYFNFGLTTYLHGNGVFQA